MNMQKKAKNTMEDIKINLKLKLASMWTSFMLLYIYVDYLHLYMPDKIADILKGRVFKFDITEGFLIVATASMIIPALMIFLSVALPAKINRWANIITASLYIPYMLFNLVGETWIHMVIAAIVEVILLLLIIRYAFKWPRIETLNTYES